MKLASGELPTVAPDSFFGFLLNCGVEARLHCASPCPLDHALPWASRPFERSLSVSPASAERIASQKAHFKPRAAQMPGATSRRRPRRAPPSACVAISRSVRRSRGGGVHDQGGRGMLYGRRRIHHCQGSQTECPAPQKILKRSLSLSADAVGPDPAHPSLTSATPPQVTRDRMMQQMGADDPGYPIPPSQAPRHRRSPATG